MYSSSSPSSSSSWNDNDKNNHDGTRRRSRHDFLSPFKVHKDALCLQMNSDNNQDAFYNLWDIEVERIEGFLKTQQANLHSSAKALLTNAQAALDGLIVAKQKSKSKALVSTTDSLESAAQVALNLVVGPCGGLENTHYDGKNEEHELQKWKLKTDELADACRRLHWFAMENKKLLQDLATMATNDNSNVLLADLQRRWTKAPWKAPSHSIVVLSDLYELIRTTPPRLNSTNDVPSPVKNWVAPTTFERSTTKFWIKDDQRLHDVLLAAVSEAPLLVYGKTGRLTNTNLLQEPEPEFNPRADKLWDDLATPITSVYFDSPSMILYKERLARREGAQLLRARWYGRQPVGKEILFLELKTHHEEWITNQSAKERVAILEQDMSQFLNVKQAWTLNDAKQVVQRAAAVEDLNDTRALKRNAYLLLRMHNLVLQHGLRPAVRTTYLRASFQSAQCNSLRITVDRNVTVLDETKHRTASGSSWCLTPDEIRSSNGNSNMTARVPFVVLEVKLAAKNKNENPTMPRVFRELQQGGILEEVSKFSKFLTGAATFFKVKTLPHWANHSGFASMFVSQQQQQRRPAGRVVSNNSHNYFFSSTNNSDGTTANSSSTSSNSSSGIDNNIYGGSGGGAVQLQEDPIECSILPGQEKPIRRLRRSVLSSTLNLGHSSSETFQESSQELKVFDDDDKKIIKSRNRFGQWFRSTPQLHANVAPSRPARVEPKSYFANERTYIQWISAGLLLVTISVILLGIDNNNNEDTSTTYARTTGIGICVGALVVVCYATFVYFRRVRLLSTASPYGYIDHFGPFLLAVTVCVGVIVLLVFVLEDNNNSNGAASQANTLRQEAGQCYLHSNRGLSKLEYQPSDVVVDVEHNALLVPSLQRIVSHSLTPPNQGGENLVTTLVEIPDSNLEGLTMVGERLFALSEGPKRTELIELFWKSEQELSVAYRWKLSKAEEAEAMTFVPDNGGGSSGRIFVDVSGKVLIYNVPNATDTVVANTLDTETQEELDRIGSINSVMLNRGLLEFKISSMFFFEGVAYVLHDNDMRIRAWDLDEGELLAEIPLPRVQGGFSKEWEGIALERREIASNENFSFLFNRTSSLRGTTESKLVLHLALDTPPQVWSMVVTQGSTRGSLVLPSCAADPDS